ADKRLCDTPRESFEHVGSFRQHNRLVPGGQRQNEGGETPSNRAGRAALRNDRPGRWETAHLHGCVRAGFEHGGESTRSSGSEWREARGSSGATADGNLEHLKARKKRNYD